MKKILFTIIFLSFLISFSCVKSSNKEVPNLKNMTDQNNLNFYNLFGFKLMNALNEKEENIVISPFSISIAMALTYEGSSGETEKEIKSVFDFPDKEKLRDIYLNQKKFFDKNDKNITLKISNGLWFEKTYKFKETYIESMKKNYDAFSIGMDFIHKTEESRKKINEYIENFTAKKIKDFIPKGMIDESTTLVLTNAIYMKSLWKEQFEKKYTKQEEFFVEDDNVINCFMMSKKTEGSVNYFENEKMIVFEYPYADSNFSVIFLVPVKDLNSIFPLDYSEIEKNISSMTPREFDEISFPKFKINKKLVLNKILKDMGMNIPFTPYADFSGMSYKKDLYINYVLHQSFLQVDEEGSEATAATGIIIVKSTAAIEKRVLKVNKPFIFMIREKNSGSILFIAKIKKPEYEE